MSWLNVNWIKRSSYFYHYKGLPKKNQMTLGHKLGRNSGIKAIKSHGFYKVGESMAMHNYECTCGMQLNVVEYSDLSGDINYMQMVGPSPRKCKLTKKEHENNFLIRDIIE